jgi:hypothetical protein
MKQTLHQNKAPCRFNKTHETNITPKQSTLIVKQMHLHIACPLIFFEGAGAIAP